MIRIVAPVYGLSLLEPAEFIYRGMFFYPKFYNPAHAFVNDKRMLLFVGNSVISKINNSDRIYYEVDLKEASRLFGSNKLEIIAEQANQLFSAFVDYMVLVKENSVSIGPVVAVLDDFSDMVINYRGIINTTNKGEVGQTSFTSQDIALAFHFFKAEHFYEKRMIDEIKEDDAGRPSTGDILLNRNHHRPYQFDRSTRAMLIFSQARRTSFLPQKISYLTMVLECIYSIEDMTEVGHKVSERAATIVGEDAVAKRAIMKDVKHGYDIRSKFLHGQNLMKSKRQPYEHTDLQELADAIGGVVVASLWEVFGDIALYNGTAHDLDQHFREKLFT